jgi:hypothetical protein
LDIVAISSVQPRQVNDSRGKRLRGTPRSRVIIARRLRGANVVPEPANAVHRYLSRIPNGCPLRFPLLETTMRDGPAAGSIAARVVRGNTNPARGTTTRNS